MLICVPDVLSKAEVADFRAAMDAADWEDGRSTAGAQSAKVKKNEQLPPNSDIARQLGEAVIRALVANPLFVSAAIPKQIFPPLFNRYGVGQHFGVHVDNAVRGDHLSGARIRTDLSVTLFLSEPEEYDGGELIVEDYYGSHRVKLPAGRWGVCCRAISIGRATGFWRARRSRAMAAVLGDLDGDGDEFGEAHDINVTPFIDVMLVLLIICGTAVDRRLCRPPRRCRRKSPTSRPTSPSNPISRSPSARRRSRASIWCARSMRWRAKARTAASSCAPTAACRMAN